MDLPQVWGRGLRDSELTGSWGSTALRLLNLCVNAGKAWGTPCPKTLRPQCGWPLRFKTFGKPCQVDIQELLCKVGGFDWTDKLRDGDVLV